MLPDDGPKVYHTMAGIVWNISGGWFSMNKEGRAVEVVPGI